MICCFNLIYGIAAIANSHVFTANAHYVFANLRAWGWITLIIGVLRLGVSVAIGSPEVCLEWSAGRALAAGATEDEIADVLLAIAPVAGLWPDRRRRSRCSDRARLYTPSARRRGTIPVHLVPGQGSITPTA